MSSAPTFAPSSTTWAGGVLDLLREIRGRTATQYTGIVLLCYEDLRKPDVWCHRQLLAEWIEERFGIQVPELPELAARSLLPAGRTLSGASVVATPLRQLSLFDAEVSHG